MKALTNFFLKNIDKSKPKTLLKADAFVKVIGLILPALFLVIMKTLIIDGVFNPTQFALFSVLALAMTAIRFGKYTLATDGISILFICLMFLAVFVKNKLPEPYFMVSSYYVYIAYVLIAAFFARKFVFYMVVVSAVVASGLYYYLRYDAIPESFLPTAEYGIYIYSGVMLGVIILSSIFISINDRLIERMAEANKESTEQNRYMRELINEVKKGVDNLTETGKKLNSASFSVTENAENQASQIEEISSETEEMSVAVSENYTNSQESYKRFKASSEKMQESSTVITETIELINTIAKRAGEISDIAFQTNILSLNASIESSKTESEGSKGFSVVADEIRKLAEKSDRVSTEISKLTEQSKKITQTLQERTETNTKNSSQSLYLLEQITDREKELINSVKMVNSNVMQLGELASNNAGSAAKLSEYAEALNKLAQSLSKITDRHKTKPE